MKTSHAERVENLFAATGWKPVSLEHRGPDGTEVIAMLLFYVCPVCAAVVAEGNAENDFPTQHRAYHDQQAKWQDHTDADLAEVVQVLRAQQPFKPQPECTVYECSATEGLKTCGPLGERCPAHYVEP